MCGRFVSPDQAAIERHWQVGRSNGNPFGRRFNVAPTATVPILIHDSDTGCLKLESAVWGMIPPWWKEPKAPRFTFNARIEEAAVKPMWSPCLRASRCLVPAVGWYEWQVVENADCVTGEIKQAKQPHFIHSETGRLFCFAGVMCGRKADDGTSTYSFAVMTTAAAPSVSIVHDRMPVMLPDAAHSAWLDRKMCDAGNAAAFAREHAETKFAHYPVSTMVNTAKNDAPELIEPLTLAIS